jgi:hypothetical protein
MKKLEEFKKENLITLKKLEMLTVRGAKVADSCWTESDPTDSDTGPCDTRYYNYSDTANGTKLLSTYVFDDSNG